MTTVFDTFTGFFDGKKTTLSGKREGEDFETNLYFLKGEKYTASVKNSKIIIQRH